MEAGFCGGEIGSFGESGGLKLEAGLEEKSVTERGGVRGVTGAWGKLDKGRLGQHWKGGGSYSSAGAFFALRLLFGIFAAVFFFF